MTLSELSFTDVVTYKNELERQMKYKVDLEATYIKSNQLVPDYLEKELVIIDKQHSVVLKEYYNRLSLLEKMISHNPT